jgi:hypothetical protein
VLGPEIEAARLGIITADPARWRVPYTQPPVENRAPKCVTCAEMLELADLWRQVRETGWHGADPVREQLRILRRARNDLAHVVPLPRAEVWPLLDLLDRLATPPPRASRQQSAQR